MNVKIMAEGLDHEVYDFIKKTCFSPDFGTSTIRILPNVEKTGGFLSGFTCRNFPFVRPEWLETGLGCGMSAFRLSLSPSHKVDPFELNQIIHAGTGQTLHCVEERKQAQVLMDRLSFASTTERSTLLDWNAQFGTGEMNRFIELSIDDNDEHWLVIHSGSGSMGTAMGQLYSLLAHDFEGYLFPDTVEYEQYMADMQVCAQWTLQSRTAMATAMARMLGADIVETVSSVHTLIGKDGILRKGAVSARFNEPCLIALNPHDGVLLCKGKGNEQWNCSAPHGAGRHMDRKTARDLFSEEARARSMEGVMTLGTQSVGDSPLAYRTSQELQRLITPTVEIVSVLKPIYTHK